MTSIPTAIVTALISSLLLPAAHLSAQISFDPVAGVELGALVEPAVVPPTGTANLYLTISLPDSIHITDRAYEFFFVEPDTIEGITWGLASYPTGGEYGGETVYRGAVKVVVPFTLGASFEEGAFVDVAGTVGYQICTETPPIYCTAPIERRFNANFAVGTVAASTIGAASSYGSGSEEPLSIEERTKQALESGSLMALLWVFIGGLLLSFTPCVYPVIPITIAYIGGRAAGSKLKGFTLSLVFVLGLALVYSTLGAIAAVTGGVFGLSTQNPYVIGFVTLVFLVMGAGMLGAFEITVPSSVQTKLSSGERRGFGGALFVGGTTGLVAAPCVGPVLVALLSWVSSSGSIVAGIVYLFVFACGLGVLFVVIGTFAGAVTALPKAGVWMEQVKKGFGIILIAAAYFFGKGLVPESWFVATIGLGLLLLAGMWGGFTRLDSDATLGRRLQRGLAGFITVVGVFYVLYGLSKLEGISFGGVGVGSGSAKAAMVETVSTNPKAGIEWIYDDEAAALARSRRDGKPVMMDFWADWCAACKELDHKTFSDPQVSPLIEKNFIPLKIDGTKITDSVKEIWARYDVRGLPTVLFLAPDGSELERFEAFRTPDQVAPILERVGG